MLSPKNIDKKPYDVCLACTHIGKNCDGPNFLAMSTERWCEWCHLRKEYLGWTNEHIANLAGISTISVNRVMSGNVKDMRVSTMQAITKVLVNGTWGQYPCAMSEFGEKETVYVDNPSLVAKVEDDEKKINFLREQIEFKEKQMDSKDQLLRERYDFLKRKDKIIAIFASLFGIALAVIVGALVIDALHTDLGFFWHGA